MSSRTQTGESRQRWTRLAAAAAAVAALALVAGSVSRAEGPPSDMGGESDMATVWTPPTAIYTAAVVAPHAGHHWTQADKKWTTWFDRTPSGGNANRPGEIVFSSTGVLDTDSTDAELFLRHADGTLEQLTDNTSLVGDSGEATPINDLNPVFSPDGEKVAFESAPAPPPAEEESGDEGGGGSQGGSGGGADAGGRPPLSGQAATQIWILDLTMPQDDPGRLTQVTFSAAADGPSVEPTWSPDGTKIAFARGSGQKAHIMIVDLTKEWGTTGRETTISTGRHFGHPSWSPTDPNVIAVTMGAGVMADVYAIHLDDLSMHRIAVTESLAEAYPSFSPDGSQIAYQQGDDAIGGAIYVVPATGGQATRVVGPDEVTPLWSDRNPGWLDDDTIVYESTRDAQPAADLGITLSGAPASIAVGGTVEYTLDVTNYGPLTAPGVKVSTTLPLGLTDVSATAQPAVAVHGSTDGHGGETGKGGEGEDETTPFVPTVTVSGGVVTADFGDLAKGDRLAVGGTVKIVARGAAAGTHHVVSTIALTPSTSSPDIYDPVSTNDSAAVDTAVTAAPAGGATETPAAPAGGGTDTTTAATTTTTTVSQMPAAVTVNGLTCTVVGTEGNDVLAGTAGRDVICGLGGNDEIAALRGNDVVFGGAGNDRIDGGAGNDWLDGGTGNDIVNGGTGRDVEHGRAGADTLTHVSGFSQAYGGPGNDRIVTVDNAYDWVNGGAGRDAAHVDLRTDRAYSVERVR